MSLNRPTNIHFSSAMRCLGAKRSPRTVLAVSALMIFGVPGAAAADLADELQRCAAISGETARLACYDALAMPARMAEPRPVATPAPAAPTPAARPAAVNAPSTAVAPAPSTAPRAAAVEPGREHLGPIEKEEEQREFTATLISVTDSPLGGKLFNLEDGQVWRQLDERFVAVPDLPAPILLKRGAFNSYTLRIDGRGRSIKVRRMQ